MINQGLNAGNILMDSEAILAPIKVTNSEQWLSTLFEP